MSNDSIARVHYFAQQFLRTQDFTDEQAYHIAMRRRHNIAHHSWGIVNGLRVEVEEDGIFVQPGFAIDGYGRELILSHRKKISANEFVARNSDELDVWLVYGRYQSNQAPLGYKRCDQDEIAEYYRLQEEPVLRIEKHDLALKPREPKSVREQDINFTPQQTPPDDPVLDWPVFLAKITRDRSNPAGISYSVDLAGRPSVGLVGVKISTPSNNAEVNLNDSNSSENTASSVSTAQSGCFTVMLRHKVNNETQETEHIRINNQGEINFKGRTSLHGDLRLSGGAIELRSSTAIDADKLPNCVDDSTLVAEQGQSPRPWRIYHHICKKATNSSTQPVAKTGQNVNDSGSGNESSDDDQQNQDAIVHQLRIEMAPISTGKNQVVIGAWSPDDEAFKPFLTVGDVNHPQGENAVTVHGDLILKGALVRKDASGGGNVDVDDGYGEGDGPRLTPDAHSVALGAFAGGISGANQQLEKFYDSPFREPLDLDSKEGIQKVLDYLAADTTRLQNFVEVLENHTVVAPKVIEHMIGIDYGQRLTMQALCANSGACEDFSGLLEEDQYSNVLPNFARSLVPTVKGREALMAMLPSGSDELRNFADLLADPRFENRCDEITETLARTDVGRNEIMRAMQPNSTQLSEFVKLLESATYEDWLPVFAGALTATNSGRTEVANRLVASEDGLNAILVAMPSHSQYLAQFAELVTTNAYTSWIEDFIANAVNAGGGRILTVSMLASGGLSAIADVLKEHQHQTWLASLINQIVTVEAVRTVVALRLLEGVDGHVAVMKAMPKDSAALGNFTGLLALPAYEDRLKEFSINIVATDSGRTEVMNALSVSEDGTASEALVEFSTLLRETEYENRLPSFAAALSSTDSGRGAIMDSLAVTDAGASNELLGFAALLIQEKYENRIPFFTTSIISTAVGRGATADSLEAESTHAEGFANLDWKTVTDGDGTGLPVPPPVTHEHWQYFYPTLYSGLQVTVCA